MNTPNNINPNGVSDGNQRVVPTDSNINPNGGVDANSLPIANGGAVQNSGIGGHPVEPTHVEYRDTVDSSANVQDTTQANAAQRVVVEDSVTHQAGDGLTAGMSPSQETPDIFDNAPQAAIKTQTDDQALVDRAGVTLIPEGQVAIADALANQDITPDMQVLSDGSVDIRRNY